MTMFMFFPLSLRSRYIGTDWYRPQRIRVRDHTHLDAIRCGIMKLRTQSGEMGLASLIVHLLASGCKFGSYRMYYADITKFAIIIHTTLFGLWHTPVFTVYYL